MEIVNRVSQEENGKTFRFIQQKPKTTKTMKTQIDVKSAVCGLIVGIAAMFALGMDSSSSNELGRYQISSGGQGCAVIVDTKTGQAWSFQPSTTAQWKNDGNFFDPKNK